jgi:SNF2 family DNA or RNA helicase
MVFEDKEARDMREMDRMRLEEQETRRKKLQKHLPYLEHAEGQQQIIINDSKYDHQGFVYISKQIAPRIKQHQIEGVRFMWSQIITDEKSMQGCLLAHTMGLGKTLQV